MKNAKIVIAFVLTLVIILTACKDEKESQLYDLTINRDNVVDIVNDLKSENIMSSKDIRTFREGLKRLRAYNDSIVGMTVGQVIEAQRDYVRASDFDVLKTASNRLAMDLNYKIRYLGIREDTIRRIVDNVERKVKANTILYEMINKSEHKIKNINGLIQFYNQNNQLIKQFEIDNPEPIPPKDSVKFFKSFIHDETSRRDSIIRYNNKSLFVKWQPITLEFDNDKKFTIEKKN